MGAGADLHVDSAGDAAAGVLVVVAAVDQDCAADATPAVVPRKQLRHCVRLNAGQSNSWVLNLCRAHA